MLGIWGAFVGGSLASAPGIGGGTAKFDDIAPVVGRGAPRSVGGLAALPPATQGGPPAHTTTYAAVALALSALIAVAARSWRARRHTR